jgi:outer membrane lipopolysaccharide assembly protein LptE/RlpB
MRRLFTALVLVALSLGGCGYHLAGSGGKIVVIPEDTQAIVVRTSGADAAMLAQSLMTLMQAGSDYTVLRAGDPKAQGVNAVELDIENVSSQFVPTAYDRNGYAIQYRLSLSGSVRLVKGDTVLWNSGPITASTDIYVQGAGGAGALQASLSQDRAKRDMRDEWARKAWEALTSGF